MEYALVSAVSFVALMRNVADQVRPGYSIGGANPVWMRNRSERLSNIGCVGYIAMSRHHHRAKSRCICCISDVGIGGFGSSVVMSEYRVIMMLIWRENCAHLRSIPQLIIDTLVFLSLVNNFLQSWREFLAWWEWLALTQQLFLVGLLVVFIKETHDVMIERLQWLKVYMKLWENVGMRKKWLYEVFGI